MSFNNKKAVESVLQYIAKITTNADTEDFVIFLTSLGEEFERIIEEIDADCTDDEDEDDDFDDEFEDDDDVDDLDDDDFDVENLESQSDPDEGLDLTDDESELDQPVKLPEKEVKESK